MIGVFSRAESFNQPIGNWNVSKVTTMREMFNRAHAFNQSIGSWNVSKVNDMYYMFFQAYDFNQDISNWDVSSVLNMQNMFYGVTLSPENYDVILINWAQLTLQYGINFHAGDSQYSQNAASARQSIIDNFNWVITDGGQIGLSITVLTPSDDQIIGAIPPSFEVYIQTSYEISHMWYTLDGGPEFFFTDNGTINGTAWGLLAEGVAITLKFYVNITLGIFIWDQVILYKDITPPEWEQPLLKQHVIRYDVGIIYNVNATDLPFGIVSYWINDTSNFAIDLDEGVITFNINRIVDSGVYWLEVRAYDGANNYCTETLQFIIYRYGTPELMLAGLNIFEINPLDTYDFTINVSLELSQDTIVIYSSLNANPIQHSLLNGLLFIEILLNDTQNLIQLNITITYKGSETLENLKGWWFNVPQGAWNIAPITVDGNVIFLSVDHASIFALSGTFPQDDGISDEEDDPFIIIIIIIIIVIVGSVALISYIRARQTKTKVSKKIPAKTIGKEKTERQSQYTDPALKPSALPQVRPPDILKAHKKAQKLKEVEEIAPALTEKEREELEKTEKEVDLQEPSVKCIVHRGEIQRNIYLCPKCRAFYCERCAKVLKLKGEKCWSCGNEIEITVSEKDKVELLDVKALDLLDEIRREYPLIDEYLTSDKSIEEIPELRTYIQNVIPEEELDELDKLKLSIEEKK